jgi:hypothetical protein
LTRSLICCVGLIKTLLICWMIILDCEHWYWRVGKSSLKWLILLTLTLETKSEENDHEVKFQEIKSLIYQEVKSFNNICQFCSGGPKNDQEIKS